MARRLFSINQRFSGDSFFLPWNQCLSMWPLFLWIMTFSYSAVQFSAETTEYHTARPLRKSPQICQQQLSQRSLWSITSSRVHGLCLLPASFLLGLFFDPDDGRNMFPPKHRMSLSGLHGVISQYTKPFNIYHTGWLHKSVHSVIKFFMWSACTTGPKW
jgi:hypothetical protein